MRTQTQRGTFTTHFSRKIFRDTKHKTGTHVISAFIPTFIFSEKYSTKFKWVPPFVPNTFTQFLGLLDNWTIVGLLRGEFGYRRKYFWEGLIRNTSHPLYLCPDPVFVKDNTKEPTQTVLILIDSIAVSVFVVFVALVKSEMSRLVKYFFSCPACHW